MHTRLATADDIPALCDLLTLLFAQEAEFTPDRAAQTRGLGQIIADEKIGRIVVLVDGEQVVGMVNLLFTVSTALGERVALLEDLVLQPEYRGQGRGTLLVEAAFVQARADGCVRLTLLTDADNLAGQAFYRKQGFVPSSMLPFRRFL